MANQPSIALRHLSTKKQYNEQQTLVYRYWFEWFDRRSLAALVVRIDLLDKAGKVLTTTSIQLPKVKLTGSIASQETGVQQPLYDSSVWIRIDDVITHEATQFSYYTLAGLFTKSASVTMTMDHKVEDLSMHG
ncbi:hypothetical protein GO755_10540 [Spirosoma sp. HMF4905]|uniref:Uncharacterized protein n=1 Tax=Spirosoma arboris TaxID=2682092 RepID=A0A7K1S9F6_9BACT|nr:hypothetical protein [Spirosoma arboris]MVM30472.1 hypothetical protein [Spirosoma arboris]